MSEQKKSPKNKPVAIFGAGGHGLGIGSVLLTMEDTKIVFLDDDMRRDHDVEALGALIVGGSEKLRDGPFLARHDLLPAVGDNRLRKSICEQVLSNYGSLTIFIDTTAVMGSFAIHPGCMIMATSVVNHGAELGVGVIVNIGTSVEHGCIIGDYVNISDGARFGGDVTVGEGAFIGLNATILPKVKIGKWATVGAGAVVTKDVPDGTTVVGNPARITRLLNSDSATVLSGDAGDREAVRSRLAGGLRNQ